MRLFPLLLLLLLPLAARAQTTAPSRKLPGLDAFPIAVWLQDPKNVDAYKGVGINTYIGLWNGPNEKQLASLQKAGMKVICDQNAEALKPAWKNTILAFMHGDEPDNAQELPGKKGYGPPILPATILADYKKLKAADPRPVILNLGQGVAWDGWYGRGTRTNHPEDYAEYAKGCDIASFDIYPACHDKKEIAGKLEFVGRGVQRLKTWATPRPVWACIETTHISNPERKATPDQVRSEVFMAIANGATGIIYFAHEFKPKFVEAGLLADQDMAAAVKKINAEVQSLAGPIFEGDHVFGLTVEPQQKGAIHFLAHRYQGTTYLIIANHTNAPQKIIMNIPDIKKLQTLAGVPVPAVGGHWPDELKPYAIGLYRAE